MIHHAHRHICVKNCDGSSKQSNLKCTMMVLPLNYCEHQNIIVPEIVFSQLIRYNNIHIYSTQSKSISVVVIL